MSIQSMDTNGPTMVDDEAEPQEGPNAEIVVKGRNVEIPEHFRTYVAEKLARLERFDRSIYLFDVELDHERNRRQRKNCQHVEITARGRGPVARGEACADSFYAAFESAISKLENRLRRSKDRRKIHYGEKTPVSLAEATAITQLLEPAPAPSKTTSRLSRTTNRAASCEPRNTPRRRWTSTTRSTRWNWSATTSSSSTTRKATSRPSSTGATPTTTG